MLLRHVIPPRLRTLAMACILGAVASELQAQTFTNTLPTPAPPPSRDLAEIERLLDRGPSSMDPAAKRKQSFAKDYGLNIRHVLELTDEEFLRGLELSVNRFRDTSVTPSISDSIMIAAARSAVDRRGVGGASPATPTVVTLYATGDVRGVFNSEESSKSTIAAGALAAVLSHGQWETTARINLVSSIDTITADYGRVLLNPATGQFASGLLDVRYRFHNRFGASVYASLSASDWLIQDQTVGATAIGVGLPLYWEGARGKVEGKAFRLTVWGGPSGRFLGGDVASLPDEVRAEELGGSKKSYLGLELGFEVRYKSAAVAFNFYWFPADEDEAIAGLSNGSVAAGVSLLGRLAGGPLTEGS